MLDWAEFVLKFVSFFLLDWLGLGWAGLGWAGLDCVEFVVNLIGFD